MPKQAERKAGQRRALPEAAVAAAKPGPPAFQDPHGLVARIALRWLLLMCVLLAIGYATKSSNHFSRFLLLSWAVTTPPLLMGLALLTHAALNRMLSDPTTASGAGVWLP